MGDFRYKGQLLKSRLAPWTKIYPNYITQIYFSTSVYVKTSRTYIDLDKISEEMFLRYKQNKDRDNFIQILR